MTELTEQTERAAHRAVWENPHQSLFPRRHFEDCTIRLRGILADEPMMSVDNFLERKHADKELDEQLHAAFRNRNYPKTVLETNENGNIIVDKDKDPQLYDFAVNG